MAAELEFHEPERVPLAGINPAPYNPRHISDEEVAALRASMAQHGVVLHFVAQREADDGTPMVMIGGHQRLRAARELCEERGWEMPEHGWAVVLDVPDREAKRLNVALNKIGGEFDAFMLGDLFASIGGGMTVDEIMATGFQPGEVDELMGLAAGTGEQAEALERAAAADLDGFARSVTLTVEFDTVERRDAVKEALRAMAAERGAKPGALVEEALAVLRAGKRGRRRPKKA